ncbi:hypothetical protein UFOVP844_61 [uncultured Caudovirales phage]|uniref:Uncharacterized protein n=1 Tax=uncultured Caudovirales phage TaxID=2100421 RepID=A0A6J5PBJ6_9CAUD|nr:hypothetical protein UFOVP844_61 [uncultured Caudovirales phage]
MKCLNCDKIVKTENWKYCDKQCRNESISKLARKNYRKTNMICRNCGKIYLVKNSQKMRSHYCSRICQGQTLSRLQKRKIVNMTIYRIDSYAREL